MHKKNFKENSTKTKLLSHKYEVLPYISKCNFNFCYFTKDKAAGQDFTEWNVDGSMDASLVNLLK